MAFATDPVAALLEIGRDDAGRIPDALLSAAYRASRQKPVMLVLNAVSAREVDAVLDPLVANTYREHRGVMYVEASDDKAVLTCAASATRVFAGSARFRAKLRSWGIPFEDVSKAEPLLDAT